MTKLLKNIILACVAVFPNMEVIPGVDSLKITRMEATEEEHLMMLQGRINNALPKEYFEEIRSEKFGPCKKKKLEARAQRKQQREEDRRRTMVPSIVPSRSEHTMIDHSGIPLPTASIPQKPKRPFGKGYMEIANHDNYYTGSGQLPGVKESNKPWAGDTRPMFSKYSHIQ